MTQWDTLGRGSNTIRWPTKGTSLSRLASTVLRAASLVPWSGGPSGNGWSRLLLRHPKGWRASQLRYVSGRKRLIEALARDRCALEHWQGWQTDLLRRGGHHVMRCATRLPRGGRPSKALGLKTIQRELWSTDPPSARSLRPGSATLTPNFWGVREVTFPELGAGTRLGLLMPSSPCWPPQLMRGKLSLEK